MISGRAAALHSGDAGPTTNDVVPELRSYCRSRAMALPYTVVEHGYPHVVEVSGSLR